MNIQRTSGILLHFTSLPGRHGIGDLGQSAYDFIDFLATAGQGCWQFLPVNATSQAFDNSPYMSPASQAGNPLLISPDLLEADGLLSAEEIEDHEPFSEYLVEFDKVVPYKEKILQRAFDNFRAGPSLPAAYDDFCRRTSWLEDYALFMSIRQEYRQLPWHQWPSPLVRRDPEALANWRQTRETRLAYFRFEQFCFFKQWQRLHNHAKEKGVMLVGDMPFYVAGDSTDVWVHQELFDLDPVTLLPNHVAGVPPDYFSATGQRWGNPVYRWTDTNGLANRPLLDWWRDRLAQIFATVDLVRIDHFRGFESFWLVPGQEETAINGRWAKGPGLDFFKVMTEELGELPIIAEDLGIITQAVEKLREDCGFPGMKILQFAFDFNRANPYLPHNYRSPNCVVYTGTHDNDTTLGWYLGNQISEADRQQIRRYTGTGPDDHDIAWQLMRLAFSSTARLAITPLQDVLGFGEDCRMNTPGTCSGNWRWRCSQEVMTENLGQKLREETEFYNRLPSPRQHE